MHTHRLLSPQWTLGSLVAVVAVAFATGTAGCQPAGPVAAGGPTAATASPSAASPSAASPAGTATTGPPATAAPSDCAAADLAFRSVNTGLATGSRYDVVVVVNRGAASCRLTGLPRLLYTDASGQVRPVPADPEVTDLPPDAVAPGATAHFAIHTVNGYAGYDPSSAHCAHPAHYQGLLLDRADGRVPLDSVRIDVLCDGVSLSDWGWPPQQ